MKKSVSAFCLIGATLALSACDTTGMGYVDSEPPYAQDRTASHGHKATAPVASTKVIATPTRVQPAEKVFHEAQTK